ncbi:MAG: hypothetical protein FJX70_02950 [Alphaproteobacteria bacterium]|nr:hypothetical protein [Alphaproteobacteria bacterium]
MSDLKKIYTAANEKIAHFELKQFEVNGIINILLFLIVDKGMDRIRPFFAFPAETERSYTLPNPIKSVNRQIRKTNNNKGVSPDDKAI